MEKGVDTCVGHRVETRHGRPKLQGYLCKVRGRPVLGYIKEKRLVSYTTIDELLSDVYTSDLPEMEPIDIAT